MIKKNRVTEAIVLRHSFEAGIIDKFKNLFYKKDKTKFDPEEAIEFSKDFKKLLDKTFLNEKWVKDNCKEVVELDNHKFPFLSMVETNKEFIVSEDLVKAVETFNSKMEQMFKPFIEVLKWGNNVFETVNKQMFAVRPNDKDYIEGYVDDEDLTEEEIEKGIAIIDAAVEKYEKEFQKKDASLKPITMKYSSHLENNKSEFKLVGKSKEYKITIEEMVKFLSKNLEIHDYWNMVDYNDVPPYFDYECPLYAFEHGRIEFSQITFGTHLPQGYYNLGKPENFFSTKTLIDVLKQFID